MNKRTSHILSAVLKQLKLRPDFESIGIPAYRQLLEKSAKTFKQDPFIKIKSFCIKAIDAQWLIPLTQDKNRIIMYIHGGGYIAGSMTTHRDLASRIAIASGAKVLIFNYRLAPENPFPKGLLDVIHVYKWLTRHFKDRYKISIAADSAGAGLALALLSETLSAGRPMPVCSVLLSPWIDLECRNKSHMTNQAKDPMLTQSVLKKTARLYTDKNLADPRISPINNTFSGICPVLIQTGGNEILIDDSKILAENLINAGATAKLEIWEEMFHVWHYFARYLPEGRQAIVNIGSFIKKY